jgi:hypothetical protein
VIESSSYKSAAYKVKPKAARLSLSNAVRTTSKANQRLHDKSAKVRLKAHLDLSKPHCMCVMTSPVAD